ncbi:hypothetical protein [Sphingobium sp. CR28]|uniref:hypothetical protein n=1 Tax=Sphingobium sp. CR28 TaxID=3400272 RepID=UPI003FEF9667
MSMGRLVEEHLLPSYFAAGFERVSVQLRDPKEAVSSREIWLERSCNEEIDVVIFNFDKYRRPAFQVHLHRREILPPHHWVRAANLVQKSSQYLHFWGKPWWLPTRYWTEHMSANTIDCMREKTEDALVFLEKNERCRNISKPVET